MKLLQFIYTSCRYGQSPGPGFQVHSTSEGLTFEEQKELEHLSIYIPPQDLPPEPTCKEISALFPVAFSFFRLRSGRFGVSRSSYLGRDYSGRFGNYLAHALVMEKGMFPIQPGAFIGSPLFKSNLLEEEIPLDIPPPPLPLINLNLANDCLELATVATALDRCSGGVEGLRTLLAEVVRGVPKKRRLIFCDEFKSLSLRIAALHMILPVHLAHGITFTTYSFDPERAPFYLCGSTPTGSRFDFERNTKTNLVWSLNFSSAIPSPPKGLAFLDLVDLNSKSVRLASFNQFVQGYDFPRLDERFEILYDLFTMVHDGFERFEGSTLQAMLSFAVEIATPPMLEILTEVFLAKDGSLPNRVFPWMDSEKAIAIASFLFAVVQEGTGALGVEQTTVFCRLVFDHLIFAAQGKHEEAYLFFRRALDMAGEHRRALLAGCITSRLATLKASINTAEQASIFLKLSLSILPKEGYEVEEIQSLPGWRAFLVRICQVISEDLELFLKTLTSQIAAPVLAAEFIDYALKWFPQLESRLSGELRPGFDQKMGLALRGELFQRGRGSLLFEEFRFLFSEARQKPAFLERYLVTVLQGIPGFRKAYLTEAIEVILAGICPGDSAAIIPNLLIYQGEIRSEMWLEAMFKVLEDGLSFDRTLSAPAQGLLQIKRERRIQTRPNILGLMELVERVEAQDQDVTKLLGDLADSKVDIALLENAKYAVFLERFLPPLLLLLKHRAEMTGAILQLEVPKKVRTLTQAIGYALNQVKKKHKQDFPRTLGLFTTCYCIDFVEAKPHLSNGLQPHLIGLLGGLGHRRIALLEREIERQEGFEERAKRAWHSMKIAVQEQQRTTTKGVVGRVMAYVQKKF